MHLIRGIVSNTSKIYPQKEHNSSESRFFGKSNKLPNPSIWQTSSESIKKPNSESIKKSNSIITEPDFLKESWSIKQLNSTMSNSRKKWNSPIVELRFFKKPNSIITELGFLQELVPSELARKSNSLTSFLRRPI
jgi:hypothetical protein